MYGFSANYAARSSYSVRVGVYPLVFWTQRRNILGGRKWCYGEVNMKACLYEVGACFAETETRQRRRLIFTFKLMFFVEVGHI